MLLGLLPGCWESTGKAIYCALSNRYSLNWIALMDMHLAVVETKPSNWLVPMLRTSLNRAILEDGKLPPELLALEGMSGKKYRIFINNLIEAVDDARYLEIGVWQGSTLCSAIYKNRVRATAIDDWSEYGGPADRFFANLSRFKGPEAALSFLDNDFRAVNFRAIGKFNVYLFDGPHEEQDQRDGLICVQPALDEQFVLIVDDWNWDVVRRGTQVGIREAGLKVIF